MVNIQSLGLVHNYKLLVDKFAHSKVHIEKVVLQLHLLGIGNTELHNAQPLKYYSTHPAYTSMSQKLVNFIKYKTVKHGNEYQFDSFEFLSMSRNSNLKHKKMKNEHTPEQNHCLELGHHKFAFSPGSSRRHCNMEQNFPPFIILKNLADKLSN